MRLRLHLTAALLGVLLTVCLSDCAPGHDLCAICEREIHSTHYASLVLEDGRTFKACCPRCALEYLRQHAGDAKELLVADHVSARLFPIESAYLLEGSDETPCLRHEPAVAEAKSPLHLCYDRCQPSLIAFRDASAATEFLREHGGRLHPPGDHALPDLVRGRKSEAP